MPRFPRTVPAVTLLIMESWQHTCCGDLFGVGDAVVWPVAPIEGDGLVALLGADLGQQVRYAVERHGDDVGTLSGTVESIRAVFHQLEPLTAHADGTYQRALPGSAQLRYVGRTQRSEQFDDDEWSATSWRCPSRRSRQDAEFPTAGDPAAS